jgi:hypothetical protein
VLTASQIIAMPDREIAMYAAGSYGPVKRTEMIATMRRLALSETRAEARGPDRRAAVRIQGACVKLPASVRVGYRDYRIELWPASEASAARNFAELRPVQSGHPYS